MRLTHPPVRAQYPRRGEKRKRRGCSLQKTKGAFSEINAPTNSFLLMLPPLIVGIPSARPEHPSIHR